MHIKPVSDISVSRDICGGYSILQVGDTALASSSFRTGRATAASLRMDSSMAPVCFSLRMDPGPCQEK